MSYNQEQRIPRYGGQSQGWRQAASRGRSPSLGYRPGSPGVGGLPPARGGRGGAAGGGWGGQAASWSPSPGVGHHGTSRSRGAGPDWQGGYSSGGGGHSSYAGGGYSHAGGDEEHVSRRLRPRTNKRAVTSLNTSRGSREEAPKVSSKQRRQEPAQDRRLEVYLVKYDEGNPFLHWAIHVQYPLEDRQSSFICHVQGSVRRFWYETRPSTASTARERFFLGHVLESNVDRLKDICAGVPIKNEDDRWNCQDWVFNAFQELVAQDVLVSDVHPGAIWRQMGGLM